MVLKIRSSVLGNHVHLRLYSGEVDGNLAHVGNLTFKVSEFIQFKESLVMGSVTTTPSPDIKRLDLPIEHVIFDDETRS